MTCFTNPLIRTALALTFGLALGFATTPSANATILAGDVIVIDFGKTGQETADNWNNVARSDSSADGANGLFPSTTSDSGFTTENNSATLKIISGNLIRYSDGAATGVNLEGRTASGGVAGIGAANITADSSLSFASTGVIPNNAQIDTSFYSVGKTIFSFTGLNDSLTYDLELLSRLVFNNAPARNNMDWIVNEGLASQQELTVNPTVAPFVQGFTGVVTNGSGVITLSVDTGSGGGANTAHINAIELTAIPEPASLALLGLGGLCMLGGRRRRA